MKKEFIHTIKYPLVFVLILISIHLLSNLYNIKLSHWGVYPRETNGLYGIISSIFIHGSWEHLFNNSIPILILGTALFHFYKNLALKVCLYSIIFTGILLPKSKAPTSDI